MTRLFDASRQNTSPYTRRVRWVEWTIPLHSFTCWDRQSSPCSYTSSQSTAGRSVSHRTTGLTLWRTETLLANAPCLSCVISKRLSKCLQNRRQCHDQCIFSRSNPKVSEKSRMRSGKQGLLTIRRNISRKSYCGHNARHPISLGL